MFHLNVNPSPPRYGGRVTSPTVVDNLVVVGMLNSSWGEQARNWNRWVAIDKKTGVPAWWTAADFQPRNTYYSAPVVTVVNGEKILIVGGAAGDVYAFRAHTGEKAWAIQICDGAINCTPVNPKASAPEAMKDFRPSADRIYAADFSVINKKLPEWDEWYKKEVQAR